MCNVMHGSASERLRSRAERIRTGIEYCARRRVSRSTEMIAAYRSAVHCHLGVTCMDATGGHMARTVGTLGVTLFVEYLSKERYSVNYEGPFVFLATMARRVCSRIHSIRRKTRERRMLPRDL